MWAQRMTTEVILTIFGKLQLIALPRSLGFGWFSRFSLCAWSRPCVSDVIKEGEVLEPHCLCDLGGVLNIVVP